MNNFHVGTFLKFLTVFLLFRLKVSPLNHLLYLAFSHGKMGFEISTEFNPFVMWDFVSKKLILFTCKVVVFHSLLFPFLMYQGASGEDVLGCS